MTHFLSSVDAGWAQSRYGS